MKYWTHSSGAFQLDVQEICLVNTLNFLAVVVEEYVIVTDTVSVSLVPNSAYTEEEKEKMRNY